jgi:hypothetical protein
MKFKWTPLLWSLLASLFASSCVGDRIDPAAVAHAADSQPPALTGADAYWQLLRYSEIGSHRSGTEGGRRTISALDRRLRGFGLQTQVETFDFPQFVVHAASLRLDDGRDVKVFPLWYSGSTGSDGISAQLVDVGLGSQRDFDSAKVSGKLVVARIPLQLRALMPSLPEVIRRAHAAGASGLIASVEGGPGNLIVASNAESEAGMCGLPVLLVGAQDGKRLIASAGRTVAFTLNAELVAGQSANIVATIPGSSSDTVVIGTPINGWFSTASERGAGVGALMTLARHYAERAAQTGVAPDKTLVFVFSGGHEVGYLGMQRFIDTHPDVIATTYAYVHLGAGIAGRFYFEQEDGTTASAPIADPARTLFVSENPLLQQIVSRRQLSSGLMPVQTLLPSVLNPGEQKRMYARGIPIISMSGTTLYFHTEADTVETTSAVLLEPAVRFYGSVIDDLLAASPADVLRNNTIAAGYAKPITPGVCAAPRIGASEVD